LMTKTVAERYHGSNNCWMIESCALAMTADAPGRISGPRPWFAAWTTSRGCGTTTG
jgi:hypothetical protein